MSIIVYGCVSTAGAITFADLEDCLVQSACIVISGEHAGQVALTLSDASNEACNDTFYGCVNPTTGQFQVSIPENCCGAGEDCTYCNAGETPYEITVAFSGVVMCPCFTFELPNASIASMLNTTHTLYQDTDCTWKKVLGEGTKVYDTYYDADCSGGVAFSSYCSGNIEIGVQRTENEVEVSVACVGSCGYFSGSTDSITGCVTSSCSNSFISENCHYCSPGAYGGTATITEVW